MKELCTEVDNQKDVVNDLLNNSLENCRQMSTDFKSDMKNNYTTIFREMTMQSEREHRERKERNVDLWKTMRHETKSAHTKLVETNHVVLKNSGILKNKMAKVDKLIATQVEKLTINPI